MRKKEKLKNRSKANWQGLACETRDTLTLFSLFVCYFNVLSPIILQFETNHTAYHLYFFTTEIGVPRNRIDVLRLMSFEYASYKQTSQIQSMKGCMRKINWIPQCFCVIIGVTALSDKDCHLPITVTFRMVSCFSDVWHNLLSLLHGTLLIAAQHM